MSSSLSQLSLPARDHGKSQTVLVVDDEPIILEICSKILNGVGFRTLVADGAEAALEICKSCLQPIEVALLDIIMPRVSGPQLADELIKFHPEVSVVFMSGYDDYRFEKYRPFGFKWFLRKPFKPVDLIAAVRKPLEELRKREPGREENVTCIRKAGTE